MGGRFSVLIPAPTLRPRPFQELYRRHGAALLAILKARFPSQAEDAAQETWQVVWTKRGTEIPHFRPWLWKVDANEALDTIRKRRPVGLGDGMEPPARTDAPLARLEHHERQQAVKECIEDLREKKPDQAAAVEA